MSLQFLESQVNQIQSEIAVYKTARNAYASRLKTELDQSEKA